MVERGRAWNPECGVEREGRKWEEAETEARVGRCVFHYLVSRNGQREGEEGGREGRGQ